MMHLRRAESPNVDMFLSAPAREEFANTRGAILEAARTHGLTYEQAIHIGSSGLAIQGIDVLTNVPDKAPGQDLDAITADSKFESFRGMGYTHSNARQGTHQIDMPGSEITLPTTVLRAPLPRSFPPDLQQPYRSIFTRAVRIGDLSTLPAAELAAAKLYRTEPRDLAAVIKAQVVAWGTEHPIASDSEWLEQVRSACYVTSLLAESRDRSLRRSLPNWLGSLASSDFGHPAFNSLYRNPYPVS